MPTVERIKWTSNRIIAISRSSATTFDTHKRYLRTDPDGILKIGGYQSTPGIWGIGSNILNHDDMWYPGQVISFWWSAPSSSSTGPLSYSQQWMLEPEITFGKYYVPKCNSAKIVQVPYSSYGSGIEYLQPQNNTVCYGPLQYVQINGKDTSIQFRWVANVIAGFNVDYNTGESWIVKRGYVAPFLYGTTLLPPMPNSSGYYRFPAPPGYIPNGTTWAAKDALGDKLLDSSGYKLKDIVNTIQGYITGSPWCVMTKLNPVTLSVGLTV